MPLSEGAATPSRPLWGTVVACCRRWGPRRALVGSGEALTYRDLLLRSEIAGVELARAVEEVPAPPLRLGLCLGNSPAHVVQLLGAWAAGVVPFLLDPQLTPGEIDAIATDCGLDAVVTEEGWRAYERRADPWPLRADTRLCRFTSGTTGRPKCLEFTGEAVVAAARGWVEGTGLGSTDRILCLASLANGLAFNTSLLAAFLAGAELCFLPGLPLSRPIARTIAEHGITRLVAFPALYRLFAAPEAPPPGELASLRQALSAGAPLSPAVREAFRQRYSLDISDYYGIAEAGPVTFERGTFTGSGLGTPLPGCQLRIVPAGATAGSGEEPGGELWVRTGSMASGYLNHPGDFEQRLSGEGFYRTGDRAELRQGRLFLVGRRGDHLNVGGRKVDPEEVLAVVLALPGVADAVIFPETDARGETVAHLVVVPAPRGTDGKSPEEIRRTTLVAALGGRLAPYKIPGRISLAPTIPRTGIGKPRLSELAHHLASANHHTKPAHEVGQGG